MEKERISIVNQIDYSDIEWLREREDACLSTLYQGNRTKIKILTFAR